MTADSNTRGMAPPPSLCPKCGAHRWVWNASATSGSWRCRACLSARNREKYRTEKSSSRRCDKCGQRLPHKGATGCPESRRQYLITRGRQRIEQQWPGYTSLLADDLLRGVGANGHWSERSGVFPLPSRLFAGLDAGLDDRLKRESRDKDIVLCRALAAVPKSDQREFLELYLKNPADADRWAALPTWKRPIRKGDADDDLVWAFFTMQRLNMDKAASDAPWALASQGAQAKQLFGTLARLSLAGVKKLCLLMSTYGAMLQDQRDLGDVVTKPWEVRSSAHGPK